METSITTPPGQTGSFTIGTRETVQSLKDLPPSHLRLLDDPVIASLACVNRTGTPARAEHPRNLQLDETPAVNRKRDVLHTIHYDR